MELILFHGFHRLLIFQQQILSGDDIVLHRTLDESSRSCSTYDSSDDALMDVLDGLHLQHDV